MRFLIQIQYNDIIIFSLLLFYTLLGRSDPHSFGSLDPAPASHSECGSGSRGNFFKSEPYKVANLYGVGTDLQIIFFLGFEKTG